MTLRAFLLLPLLMACSPTDPPLEGVDLPMSEPVDLSAPSDLGPTTDLSSSPATFTWNEVNGWYVLQAGSPVCGPYLVDAGPPPTVESILRQFCVARGFSRYTVGCSRDLLQSVTCS